MSSEEAKLLASVGGVMEEMDRYEEEVIQKAQRETAPKLDGHGFPALEKLGPSHSVNKFSGINRSDVPHFRIVLNKIREELSTIRNVESRRSKVLRIKEQLTLSYLEEVAKLNNDEMPTSLHVEIHEEQLLRTKLSEKLRKLHGGKELRIGNNSSISNSSSKDSTEKKKRLELIQQNKLPDSGNVLPVNVIRSRKRSRTSMMDWKNKKQKNIAEHDDDEEIKERRMMLREIRAERCKLREKRLSILNLNLQSENKMDEIKETRAKPENQDEENSNVTEFLANNESIENEKTVASTKKSEITDQNSVTKDSDILIGEVDVDVINLADTAVSICKEKIETAKVGNSGAVLAQPIANCEKCSGPQMRARFHRNCITKQLKDNKPKRRRLLPRCKSSGKISSSTKNAHPSPKVALDDMDESLYEDRVDEWIENGLSKMKVMGERDTDELLPGAVEYPGNFFIPAWINNRLFSYQRAGLRWMWELHEQEAGGIVGDEMGLGKTVQVCSYLGCMVGSRKIKSALVVCPATLLHHWLKELSVWAPGLRRILIHKSGEKDGFSRSISPTLLKSMSTWLRESRSTCLYEAIDEEDLEEKDVGKFVGTGYVFVTTYENIRRYADVWTSHKWSYVVLDEGQKIRNPDADVTLACKRFRTPHRLLLSGTPIQNDLKELWTLFDFVFPGRLGTLPAFETEFAQPIKKGGYVNASPMVAQLAYRCALTLKDLINPYLLRRQKKDVKEVNRMPNKTEQVLFCRLSKQQRDLYESYLQSDEVRNILRGSLQLFRSITILRKICNHPDLLCEPNEEAYEKFVRMGFNQIPNSCNSDDENEEITDNIDSFDSITERSGKMQILAKILPLWQKQGHRVLIFCQWTKMLNVLQQYMMNEGWKFARMDGKTSVGSRQQLVDTFNSDESYFAMLMTTRTGGVGLNLTGANRVVIYDPDWNPQTDSQARARSHRFGQTKPVTIYRLITAGTIEEKIYHRQIFKTALTNRVLQDPKQKRLFSQKDLRDFFSLKSDDGSVINGSHGITELGAITRGKGVINPEELISEKGENSVVDDKETLETVMKSRGLAGVFDHDFIDSSAAKKSKTVKEMEDAAKKVAEEAAKALEKSSRNNLDRFQPTWTGSKKTLTSRFGHRNGVSTPSSFRARGAKGNHFVVGAGVSHRVTSTPSSKSLLKGLKNFNYRENEDKFNFQDVGKYTVVLKRVKDFVKKCGGNHEGGGPTTNEMLKEFDDVPTLDAAIFRRLLTSVAIVEGGRWRLK